MLKLGIANLGESVNTYTLEALPTDLELEKFPEFQTPIHVKLSLNKVVDSIYVKAEQSAECNFICDRCLEPFVATVSDTVRMIFTSSSSLFSKSNDYVFSISEGTNEIDLALPVKESMILALPSKRVCSKDCKGLCPKCGENLNKKHCTCSNGTLDPRWEVLKQFREQS